MSKKPSAKSSRRSSKNLESIHNVGTRSRYNSIPESESELETTSNPFVNNDADRRRKRKNGRSGRGSKEEIELEKLSSSPTIAPLSKLTKKELKIFQMVESGDVAGLREMLSSEEFKNFDINKTNRMGYTALHVAIHNQNEDMVKVLLGQEGIRLLDTILHAINVENAAITKILLEFYDNLERLRDASDEEDSDFVPYGVPISMRSGVKSSIIRGTKPKRTACGVQSPPIVVRIEQPENPSDFDSEFNPVITPLMLAAEIGNIKLMEIFYQRGECLETEEYPHNSKCECDICEILIGEQDMTRVHQRIQLFKSITSPKYICFISRKEKKDPIKYAIDKIIHLRKICEKIVVNEKLYEEFLEKLQDFIVQMLDLCRTTEEAEIFLSPKDTDRNEYLPFEYPRLWYTAGLELRKFVAHHNTQNILHKMWIADWPQWDNYSRVWRFAVILFRCSPLFVIPCLIRWLAPKSTLGSMLNAPAGRFLDYIGSYIVFLALLSIQVLLPYQRCNDKPPYYTIDDVHCKQRGPPHIGTEWALVVYVVCFYLSVIRKQRISSYWGMKWNWFELATLLSFTATFFCWASSWAWTKVPKNIPLVWATDRLMWPQNCFEVLGECFISLSTVFAFGRLLHFTQIFPSIGPIQIGLGRQIVDFLSTALIYVIVLFAFASGLLGLYVPYKDFKGFDTNNKPQTQDNTFTDFSLTLQNLFWYLYGHAGNDPAKLLSWEVENADGSITLVHHHLTEKTGLTLYFFYHVTGSMMLFTMLSGYFAQTLSFIMGDIDTHWKYNRTELYLTFMKDTSLPPPFNLIPPLPSLLQLLSGQYCARGKDDKRVKCSCRQCCYIAGGEEEKRWVHLMKSYRKLIVELMFRYNEYNDVKDSDDASMLDEEEKMERDEIRKFLGKSTSTKASSTGGSRSDHRPPGPGRSGTRSASTQPSGQGAEPKASKSTGSIPPSSPRSQAGGGSKSATTLGAISQSPSTAGPSKSQSKSTTGPSKSQSKSTTGPSKSQSKSTNTTGPSNIQSQSPSNSDNTTRSRSASVSWAPEEKTVHNYQVQPTQISRQADWLINLDDDLTSDNNNNNNQNQTPFDLLTFDTLHTLTTLSPLFMRSFERDGHRD